MKFCISLLRLFPEKNISTSVFSPTSPPFCWVAYCLVVTDCDPATAFSLCFPFDFVAAGSWFKPRAVLGPCDRFMHVPPQLPVACIRAVYWPCLLTNYFSACYLEWPLVCLLTTSLPAPCTDHMLVYWPCTSLLATWTTSFPGYWPCHLSTALTTSKYITGTPLLVLYFTQPPVLPGQSTWHCILKKSKFQ